MSKKKLDTMKTETRHVIVLKQDVPAARKRWADKGWKVKRVEAIPRSKPPSARLVIERSK